MGKGRTLLVVVVGSVTLVTLTFGIATAQSDRSAGRGSGDVIHVVKGPAALLKFNDFDGDGLTLGDRLAGVAPVLNEDQTKRVGTSYLDCWVGDKELLDQSPYVCTDVLKLKGGNITTQGLDPHGDSDVFFAVTGGTGVYDGATGQAEYIDSGDQTDVIITLDE
jgi:hypothetical protein